MRGAPGEESNLMFKKVSSTRDLITEASSELEAGGRTSPNSLTASQSSGGASGIYLRRRLWKLNDSSSARPPLEGLP